MSENTSSASALIEYESESGQTRTRNRLRLLQGKLLSDRDFSSSISQPIELLFSGDENEKSESMGKIQQELRSGVVNIYVELATMIEDENQDTDNRSLALETVAGARARQFERKTEELVILCLNHPDHDLKFAAIAAASDLYAMTRRRLVPRIGVYENDLDMPQRVRRAASAFINS